MVKNAFAFKHLPAGLMSDISKGFAELALRVVQDVPPSAERSAALRHLVEAKDCAVRAVASIYIPQAEADFASVFGEVPA